MAKRFELLFHRADDPDKPEAFGYRDPDTGALTLVPHTYWLRVREDDGPVASAELPWSDGLFRLLGRLQTNACEGEVRHEIGALLRDFLAKLGRPIPDDEIEREATPEGGPARGPSIIITIRSSAAELYALPWELTSSRSSNRHWADREDLLVRYEWPGLGDPELPAAPVDDAGLPQRRIVFAWSAAGGAVPAAEHLRALEEAASRSGSRSRSSGVHVDVVPHVSQRALEEALSAGRATALHILCHGAPPRDAGSPASLQWDTYDSTGIDRVDADAFARLLDPFRKSLRLVVLCACYGGDARPVNLFLGSCAQAVHRRGIPAVVASRYPLSPAGSIRLARSLYADLLASGRSLEGSLLRARRALRSPSGRGIEGAEPDDFGALFEDSYALQLYARSRQAVRAQDGSIAYRPADATYPFADDIAPPPLGRLVNVPELPPNFLDRKSDLEQLKALVLGGSGKAVGLTGRTIRAGVHGMGGIGKSVLAAWLARDADVQRAFPDGIFWLTLGRDCDSKLTSLQAELCASLGEPGSVFENEHRGRTRLTELLRDRDRGCLVILDDVWDARHAAAFGELGLSGRLLITTRDAGILTTVGAEPCSLDVLSNDQALELLGRWSGNPVEALSEEAREVAKECGYLPLALAMIGAMVRGRPDRWSNALLKLRRADLHAIRRDFPDYAYPDLLRAIEVSLDALEPWERERYLDFAVFSEDTPVPEAVLRTLWGAEGLAEYKAQDLLDLFVDRSLLRRDDQGRLGQHDLQYDYVRKRVGDISSLHRRLVDAYLAACPRGLATGPDDGYFFSISGSTLSVRGEARSSAVCSSISTGFGRSFRSRIQRRCSAIMGLFQGVRQRGS